MLVREAMTNEEFRTLTLAARDSLSNVTRGTMRGIRRAYKDAADSVADAVAAARLAGHAQITVESMVSIQRQLEAGADAIRDAVEAGTLGGVRISVEKIGSVHDRYISSVFNRAGVTIVDRAVIAQIVSGVNERVIRSVVNRVWQDGYTFSRRVWRVGSGFIDDIRNVISAGLAQGRDVLDIARDIQVYTADGRVALMERYGTLERGTREFSKRIPRRVDWRALRLARSELYASLMDANIEQGKMNPASTELWDWVRQGSIDHDCDCPDYARNSPYKLNDLPGYPHANCLCTAIVRLQNQDEFNERLQDWAAGKPDPDLDQWYTDVYLPEAA